MNKPTYPLLIENGQYIDYEISYELPSDLDNKHSVVVRLSYDTSEKIAYGYVVYVQNGFQSHLGDIKLTNERFYRITNHPVSPEDKLVTLRSVKGSVTIENGVATLPDGTAITL
jgi:hypothetical protein